MPSVRGGWESHAIGCLLAIFAGFFPRVALVIVWIATDLVDRAFSTFIIPLLGLIFLPFTTLVFALAWAPGRAPRKRPLDLGRARVRGRALRLSRHRSYQSRALRSRLSGGLRPSGADPGGGTPGGLPLRRRVPDHARPGGVPGRGAGGGLGPRARTGSRVGRADRHPRDVAGARADPARPRAGGGRHRRRRRHFRRGRGGPRRGHLRAGRPARSRDPGDAGARAVHASCAITG